MATWFALNTTQNRMFSGFQAIIIFSVERFQSTLMKEFTRIIYSKIYFVWLWKSTSYGYKSLLLMAVKISTIWRAVMQHNLDAKFFAAGD